jgi:crotonobetainyl-CoA:carnitine CoA-transferase CaiB-like acyl-CoA transferase
MLPLEGLVVVDFSQFLAGPLCALRLADLGARVIKVERPDGGDLCRQLYIANLRLDDDSTLFHSINRNKESFAANLKDPADLDRVRKLVAKADVVIQNFRPGVMKRLGLDYDSVRVLNPRAVYGSISGYGDEGPWKEKPGQDLLAQSLSGLLWLTGDAGGELDSPDDHGRPVPMGLAVADMFAGHFLAQGILACLVRRGTTGRGGLVETSLMEALLDFQFEVLTTHLNDGGQKPRRASHGNGHAYLGAPYGVYRTADGWLALAMNPLAKLAPLLELPSLAEVDRSATFARRDSIQRVIAERLKERSTRQWLDVLEPADVWCAEVLDWPRLLKHAAFAALGMTQTVTRSTGSAMNALRCPVRVDGQRLYAPKGSPAIGEQTAALTREFNL